MISRNGPTPSEGGSEMKEQITYFARIGKQNTDETLAVARDRAKPGGV